MKSLFILLCLAMTSVSVADEKNETKPLPPGHPPVNGQQLNMPAAASAALQKATVQEVISVPQYTYLEVKTFWLAAPTVDVKKGDTVSFEKGLMMKDFHSNSLDRTFASILFVNRVVVGG